jgi:hypothetical protein
MVLREGFRGKALKKVKVLCTVSEAILRTVRTNCVEDAIRIHVVVVCQGRDAAAGLELKVSSRSVEERRDCQTYLLLGPQ